MPTLPEKYLDLRAQISEWEKTLTDKKETFEKSVLVEKNQLESLYEQELDYKKELIADMDKQHVTNMTEGNKQIIRLQKVSLKIGAQDQIQDFIEKNFRTIKKLLSDKEGVEIKEGCIEYLFPREANIKAVIELADRYYKIEGQHMDGIEEQKTDYLQVKEKKYESY